MFVNEVTYEITPIELCGPNSEHLNYRMRAMFARGNQTQVSTKTKATKQQVFSTPATAADWLKQLITEWEPTLKFGWLRPQLKSVTVDVVMHQENTYYNVVPMPIEERRERLYVARFGYRPMVVSGEDWLEMNPCTAEDIARARDEERKLTRNEQAWYMR